MKRLIIVVVLLLASYAFAGDVITLKHGVEFDHKGHQTKKVGICTVCHDERIGKIDGFGKEWAHIRCINCHNLHKEGPPITCGGCHKTMSLLKE